MKANRLPRMLLLNGSSDYLTLPIVPATTGFSLAFWMMRSSYISNARIFDCQDAGPANGFMCVDISRERAEFINRNGSTTTCAMDTIKSGNGRLNHYVFTFDGTTAKLYENNVLIASDTSADMGAFLSTALYVSRRASSASGFWNGKLGEIVLQNTPIPWTESQISELYYGGKIPSGASFWLFDGNVLDGSGNGNHGTLTGGTYIDTSSVRSSAIRSAVSNRIVIQPFAGSAQFDGSSSYIQLPIAPSINAFSFLFRVNVLSGFPSGGSIFNWESAFERNGVNVKLSIGANNLFLITVASASSAEAILSKSLSLGRWYNFALTYVPNSCKLYLDGVLVSSDTSVVATPNANLPTIGRRAYSSGGYGKFNMNDFAYCDNELSLSEINDFFNKGKIPNSMKNRWILDDVAGIYVDSIGGATAIGFSMTKSSNSPMNARVSV